MEVVGEEALYKAITRALLNGMLRPGTALRERYLAEEFAVTRGLVRKVLLRLGQEGKLEMHPNRGAYVPEPSVEQIRFAYEARKAVEAGVVSLLAASITTAQLAQINKHLRIERAASRHARRDESVQLAGDFHLLLAHLLGNPVLLEMVQRLVNRTQMFVALFEPAQFSDCAPNEHAPVVQALARKCSADAAEAMVKHLSMVEQRVLVRAEVKEKAPLAAILRTALLGQE
jgi:DNA-binding GntR family transcriptional regulator